METNQERVNIKTGDSHPKTCMEKLLKMLSWGTGLDETGRGWGGTIAFSEPPASIIRIKLPGRREIVQAKLGPGSAQSPHSAAMPTRWLGLQELLCPVGQSSPRPSWKGRRDDVIGIWGISRRETWGCGLHQTPEHAARDLSRDLKAVIWERISSSLYVYGAR